MEHTKSPRTWALVAVLASTLVLLAACRDQTPVGPGDDIEPTTSETTAEPAATPLVDTVWLLDTVYLAGEEGEPTASTVEQGVAAVELVIGPTTATVRSGPCTDAVYDLLFATVEAGGSFEVIGGGGVECRGSESDNANHDLATGALVSASGYRIDADRLILLDEEGELIGFSAQDAAAG